MKPVQRIGICNTPCRRGKAAGFTLVEVAMAVIVAMILAAIAAPAYTNMIAGQRTKNAASDLFASLFRARSEALTRNAVITVTPKAGGWQNGWQMLDPANAVLEDHGVIANVNVAGPASVVYRTSGRVQGTVVPMFTLQPSTGGTSNNRCISVDLNGRPYTKVGTTC